MDGTTLRRDRRVSMHRTTPSPSPSRLNRGSKGEKLDARKTRWSAGRSVDPELSAQVCPSGSCPLSAPTSLPALPSPYAVRTPLVQVVRDAESNTNRREKATVRWVALDCPDKEELEGKRPSASSFGPKEPIRFDGTRVVSRSTRVHVPSVVSGVESGCAYKIRNTMLTLAVPNRVLPPSAVSPGLKVELALSLLDRLYPAEPIPSVPDEALLRVARWLQPTDARRREACFKR